MIINNISLKTLTYNNWKCRRKYCLLWQPYCLMPEQLKCLKPVRRHLHVPAILCEHFGHLLARHLINRLSDICPGRPTIPTYSKLKSIHLMSNFNFFLFFFIYEHLFKMKMVTILHISAWTKWLTFYQLTKNISNISWRGNANLM